MTGGQVRTRLMVDGTLMVELRGRLDPACATGLRDQLAADVLAMRPRDVVVDLGPVTSMHSTALRALMSVQDVADSIGASLRVANPGPFAPGLPPTTGAGTAPERMPVAA